MAGWILMVERDIFRPPSRYRRWLAYGVLLAGVLFVTRAIVDAASRPRPPRAVRLSDCMEGNRELCRGGEVALEGAYVPDSVGQAPGCAWRVELQAPGGGVPGKLEVCVKSDLVPASLFPGACGDARMARVLANGYYPLRATGQLKGSVFYADSLGGGGCDPRFYSWKYGHAAVD